MGQCTSILPPSELDDDFSDGLSIATAQTDPNNPWRTQLSEVAKQKHGDSLNLSKDFLKIHSADRPAKCILDPTEVATTLNYQADELLRRDRIRHQGLPENDIIDVDIDIDNGDGTDEDSLSRIGGGSTFTDYNSTFAPSVLTTESTATRQIANVDKVSRRKRRNDKFSVLETLDEGAGISRADSSISKDSVQSPDMSALSLQKTASISSLESWVARRATHQPKTTLQMYTDVMSSCFQPATFERRKEQYKSVLHLKMKANLFNYYQSRFLPSFPNAPVPPGLSKMHLESPRLAYSSDASSSSSSDGQIGFGIGPPSTPVQLLADQSVFMDLSITGSLGMVPRRRASSSRRRMHGNRKSPDDYVVLINRRSGIPLAVCARKAAPGPPVVRIYATKPRVYGQRPAATTGQLGFDWTDNSLPLYTFAEIVTEGAVPKEVNFSIFVANGSDGRFASQPNYKASFLANGSPDIKVVGHTDKEQVDSGCALISLKANNNIRDRDEASFQLSIAQGIDPALFICFTAVVDEILEKSMRAQVKQNEQQRKAKLLL